MFCARSWVSRAGIIDRIERRRGARGRTRWISKHIWRRSGDRRRRRLGTPRQKIGQFNDDAVADDFCVDYVKVYQNENDLPAVQPDSDFTGSFDLDEKRYAKSALQQQGAFYCV